MDDPAKLARYREIRKLGSGGMGTVSLAEDTVLGRQVALKRVTGSAGDQGLLRLRREALVGASVSHPNLVSIYDVETAEDGDVVIVMEYVEGQTLRDAISRGDRMAPDRLLAVLAGAAAGLDAIHEEGIVHRDVKPANILIGRDGTAKVADLGIASVTDQTRITTSGSVLGSLSYMAPEQLKDAPATPAIDIYALAAVAYEALSGQKARRETNPVALAYAISTQPAPDLRDVWPEAPAATAELLMRAMAQDPSDRPRSAGELVARLRATVKPEPTAPVAPPAVVPPPEATPAVLAPPPADPPTATHPAPRRKRTEAPVVAAAAAAAEAPASAAAAEAPASARASEAPARAAAGEAPATAAADPRPGGRGGAATTAASGRPAEPGPSRHWLIPGLVALVAVAILAVVLLSSGGSSPTKSAQGSSSPRSAAAKSSATQSSSSTTSAGAAAAPAAAGAHSPVAAVQSFYRLAAAHQYSSAWALADPTFQSQLGGYQSFQNTFSGDRSITFGPTQTLNQSGSAATVAIKTTSVRTDGTQNCSGTVQLRSGSSSAQWQLHQIQISCS